MNYEEAQKKKEEQAREKLRTRVTKSIEAVSNALTAKGWTVEIEIRDRHYHLAMGFVWPKGGSKKHATSIEWSIIRSSNGGSYRYRSTGDERFIVIVGERYGSRGNEKVQSAKDDPDLSGERAQRIVDAIERIQASYDADRERSRVRDSNKAASEKLADACNQTLGSAITMMRFGRVGRAPDEVCFKADMQLKGTKAKALAACLNAFFATYEEEGVNDGADQE